MIVVSDTSPIINLAMIGQLDLLRLLFAKIVIPEAVFREIVIEGQGQSGAEEIQQLEWFESRSVPNNALLNQLKSDLDIGEAEAIALAIELDADAVLIDEHKGRTIALQHGLKITGIIGVLIAAKQKGYISKVKPFLDDLRNIAHFWISEPLYIQTLKVTGELE